MAQHDDMSEDTADALAMIGRPIVQFEPPAQQIIKTKQGFKTVTTDGWIKFGIAFRNELAKMEGESLAVFMCICLHVNSDKEAWPSLDTICRETNRARATVVKSIKHLKKLGLLEVTRDPKHRSNTYRPLYAAYGSSSDIELPTVQILNSNSSTIEPEVEPVRRTKEGEKSISRKREPTPHNPSLLITSIKHGDELQAAWDMVYESMGRKSPKEFVNILQKEAYNSCAETLNGKFMEAVRHTLQRGRISRGDVLASLKAWVRNELHPNPSYSGNPQYSKSTNAVIEYMKESGIING